MLRPHDHVEDFEVGIDAHGLRLHRLLLLLQPVLDTEGGREGGREEGRQEGGVSIYLVATSQVLRSLPPSLPRSLPPSPSPHEALVFVQGDLAVLVEGLDRDALHLLRGRGGGREGEVRAWQVEKEGGKV